MSRTQTLTAQGIFNLVDNLRELIDKTDDYCLMVPGNDGPAPNTLACFKLALTSAGEEIPKQAEPLAIIGRAGEFVFKYRHELEKIQIDLFIDFGLYSEIAGGPKIGDLKLLNVEQAKELQKITLAIIYADMFIKDISHCLIELPVAGEA